ncbi:hypothetical protein [Shivajiella indica]|uniref:Acyloxyacyl hydrolase n=1 Tax=Shivajiella indica TaxID=872115 RepID=A0ABW5B4I5_9BACT
MRYLSVFFCILGIIVQSFAQEEEKDSKSLGHEPRWRGAIMMGNSHVPKAFDGEKNILVIPTWGFDLDYYFHPSWSFAFQSDIKLQSFEVKEEGALLERSFPFSTILVGHYHFKRHWSVYAGPGYEFEKNENLFLWRIGTEYSFEISENFEIALNFIYENKQNIYDTWMFGVAFNKVLGRK